MRSAIFTVALLSTSFGIFGADTSGTASNPYVRLTQVIKDGMVRVSAKNVSNKPIVAYVVALEDGDQSKTHHNYYTGRDTFGPGKTIELIFALHSASSTPRVFVDYVRLADKSTWGNPVTEEGRDVAASFQN
jgi:hypothetical protein